jgi:hypothetical protein
MTPTRILLLNPNTIQAVTSPPIALADLLRRPHV